LGFRVPGEQWGPTRLTKSAAIVPGRARSQTREVPYFRETKSGLISGMRRPRKRRVLLCTFVLLPYLREPARRFPRAGFRRRRFTDRKARIAPAAAFAVDIYRWFIGRGAPSPDDRIGPKILGRRDRRYGNHRNPDRLSARASSEDPNHYFPAMYLSVSWSLITRAWSSASPVTKRP
jgi:hypothetical protein